MQAIYGIDSSDILTIYYDTRGKKGYVGGKRSRNPMQACVQEGF